MDVSGLDLRGGLEGVDSTASLLPSNSAHGGVRHEPSPSGSAALNHFVSVITPRLRRLGLVEELCEIARVTVGTEDHGWMRMGPVLEGPRWRRSGHQVANFQRHGRVDWGREITRGRWGHKGVTPYSCRSRAGEALGGPKMLPNDDPSCRPAPVRTTSAAIELGLAAIGLTFTSRPLGLSCDSVPFVRESIHGN
ncbi:hypothetical protein THAOC_23283 [Thalassiosira oceanica]|uniref:Uncharacterized protein n=1 Tax=Thalassiosira oceanica TaxID=159749 RepID=K0SDQ7_THAOC|nr:hypothetical protein THAOC_23283 [Thalassiosira oceanica]|eukprot:EJK56762.1 hypothetical protein THAOC_23283 [Thalassiosira oceanica]